MSDRDNLTTRDLAEPRTSGEETAEDMPLTREDHPDAGAREPVDRIERDAEAGAEPETSSTDRPDAGRDATTLCCRPTRAIGSSSGGTRSRRASSTSRVGQSSKRTPSSPN
jgi:hypothetical protein